MQLNNHGVTYVVVSDLFYNFDVTTCNAAMASYNEATNSHMNTIIQFKRSLVDYIVGCKLMPVQ